MSETSVRRGIKRLCTGAQICGAGFHRAAGKRANSWYDFDKDSVRPRLIDLFITAMAIRRVLARHPADLQETLFCTVYHQDITTTRRRPSCFSFIWKGRRSLSMCSPPWPTHRVADDYYFWGADKDLRDHLDFNSAID
jgi:hypothetical protein